MPDWQSHPSAICETDRIGTGSAIEALAHVAAGAMVGTDCRVGSHAHIGSGVVLDDRVWIESGARIAPGARLETDVTVGANSTIGYQPLGRSSPDQRPSVVIRRGACIGANVTIVSGLTIGAHARLAPGSVVTRSVPDNAIVTGNPAQIVGYAALADLPAGQPDAGQPPRTRATSVRGVTLYHMREVEDMRGNLSVAELGREVPFEVKRYFLVYGVPNMEVRGEHAHLECHQFLIAVKGSLHVVADDGRQREEFVLDRPSLGLHLPPMTWGTQHRYSADAVLLVLASHHYDAADYVRDHDRFLALVAAGQAAP
jgi:UDP-2-acetamido-3-amino-2,3-dideoxy-glucuronate N-acetyltransferase